MEKKEIARLKAEQGIQEIEEPGVNQAAGAFRLNVEGVKNHEGQSYETTVPNEPEGIPGATKNSK